jgi:8-amino-7-oxononanoate synthase
MLRWSKAPPERVVIIASLAKSLGVPMAVISGPGHFIREFRANSGTMDHCSPASIAHLSAATNALELNRSEGDSRRAMLYANVSLFRQGLFAAGLRPKGGLFPVQHLDRLPRKEVLQLYEQLQKEGIRTVVTKGHRSGDSQLTMLLRSDHRPKDIGLLTHKIIRFCSKKHFSYDNYH